MNYRVMLLPGDGIGPEIMEVAVDMLNLAAEKFGVTVNTESGLIGGSSYDEFGTSLTDETLEKCFNSDAVLLGSVGGPKWEELQHNLKPEAALLRIRKELGLWANLRPAKVYTGFVSASSLKDEVVRGTDFIVVRELGGGIYYGEPRGFDNDKGFSTMVYTREEIERIVREAFELARSRKKVLHSVDKANVLEVSQLWRNIANEVHEDYPDVELNHMYVDNAAMQLVLNPKKFDVIVTGNMFGDILSDVAGMITGSLGMLPSASLGTKYAMYEPVHGSAPDIMGQGIANPIAMIASVAMMFTHSFNLPRAGKLIERAIEMTLLQGYRTQDIHSLGFDLVNTVEMGGLICNNFNKIYETELTELEKI